ncbi:hypothetical protein [Calidifontibacillus erzurumensis]
MEFEGVGVLSPMVEEAVLELANIRIIL